MCVSHWRRRARVSPWSRGTPAAACRAPRWTRGAPPRRLIAQAVRHFRAGASTVLTVLGRPDRSTTADVSVDAADAYLAHLEGENDSLRNKDEKVKWWHVARARGSSRRRRRRRRDGRTNGARARASRACRRVTLSARLSSKHAPSSSRRSDTSQPLFGRDVERDATTLARRALALVRGGDGASGSGESSSSRAHATPGRFSSARRASDGNAMESLDEPLLSEASRSLRAEALAEASLETHVEAGVVRLLASGAAAHAASALSRALAALPETHPMRVAAPPPGAAVPPAAVSLRAAQMLVAFQEGLISETPLKKAGCPEKAPKKGAVVLTLRDAEAFFAASLAGAQHADHAFVAARAGALTHAGGDAAIVGLLTHTDSFPGGRSPRSPRLAAGHRRRIRARPPDAGTNERPNEKKARRGTEESRDAPKTRARREPWVAFAAIVTGGAARVSASREAGDDSEGSVGENAKTKTGRRRRRRRRRCATRRRRNRGGVRRRGSRANGGSLRVGTIRRRGSRRVAARRVFLAEGRARAERVSPGRSPRGSRATQGTGTRHPTRDRRKQVCHRRRAQTRARARAQTRGGTNGRCASRLRRRRTPSAAKTQTQTDPRAADRPFPRGTNASAHVARPVVEGDDSDVIDVVPATARAARDAGYRAWFPWTRSQWTASRFWSRRTRRTATRTRLLRLEKRRRRRRRASPRAAAPMRVPPRHPRRRRRARAKVSSRRRVSRPRVSPPRAAFCSPAPTAGTFKPDRARRRRSGTVGNPRASRSRRPRGFRVRGESRDAESARRRLRHRRSRLAPRHRRLLRTNAIFHFKKRFFFARKRRQTRPNEKREKTGSRSRLRGRRRHVFAVLRGAGGFGARARTRVLREAPRRCGAPPRGPCARLSRTRERLPRGDGVFRRREKLDAFESPRTAEAPSFGPRG